MQLTQLVANDTLLTYGLSTSPSPLQVSPQSGPPSVAALTFVISCPVSVGQVTVTQIAFNLVVGSPSAPESTDLTEVGTGITPSVSSTNWQIAAGTAAGSFVLTPAAGTSGIIAAQGLTVTLVGIQVGPVVGTTLINIVEDATADSSPPQVLVTSIAVAKFPYGVVVGDFSASAPMVQHDSAVTLSWIGSVGPTYTLLWAQQSQNVTTVNQWTSPDLTDTTTFILSVVAQEGGETVTIQFSLTVIVADPDITATTLDVLQASTLQGDVAISGVTTAATVNAAVLNISGASALAGATVSGALQAGSFTSPSAALTALTVGGSLSANAASISLLAGGQPVGPGTFSAGTDGFVVGIVTCPEQSLRNNLCNTTITASTSTAYSIAMGGNAMAADSSGNTYCSPNSHSFLLPVSAGSQCSLGVYNDPGNQTNAPTVFYWIPFGVAPGGVSFIRLSDYHPPQPAHLQPGPRRSDEARWKFIATLEHLLGKPIDAVTKQQLISELRQF